MTDDPIYEGDDFCEGCCEAQGVGRTHDAGELLCQACIDAFYEQAATEYLATLALESESSK
jgi:hypothetical protein